MSSESRIAIENESDIVAARRRGREVASEVGFSGTYLTIIATAISEVARNIVTYAQRGEILIDRVTRGDGVPGISVVARDQGPGIASLSLAMQDGYSTGHSLGLGLPGAKRLMDEFAIESSLGQGTTVTMKKWLR